MPGRILVHCWICIDPDGSNLLGECLVKRFQLRLTGILVFLIVEPAFIRQRRLSLDSEDGFVILFFMNRLQRRVFPPS